MSRAQLLACGSTLALAGCNGAEATAPPGGEDATAGPTHRVPPGAMLADALVADTFVADATTDCAPEEPLVGFAAGHGMFLCQRGPYLPVTIDAGVWVAIGDGSVDADLSCNRSTQYCFQSHGQAACRALGDTCYYQASDGCCGSQTIRPTDAGCAGGPLRCACLVGCSAASYWCSDDDAGGVIVSCGTCYGSPPARLVG